MQGKPYLHGHATIPEPPVTFRKTYRSQTNPRILAKRLDAVGWGLFFLWVGFALLANMSWGLGLLGVGMIILAIQAARKYFALKWEGFWVVLGVLNVLFGIWLLFNLQTGILPSLCILAGASLLLSALASRIRDEPGDQD
jgi:hypothetical protein